MTVSNERSSKESAAASSMEKRTLPAAFFFFTASIINNYPLFQGNTRLTRYAGAAFPTPISGRVQFKHFVEIDAARRLVFTFRRDGAGGTAIDADAAIGTILVIFGIPVTGGRFS